MTGFWLGDSFRFLAMQEILPQGLYRGRADGLLHRPSLQGASGWWAAFLLRDQLRHNTTPLTTTLGRCFDLIPYSTHGSISSTPTTSRQHFQQPGEPGFLGAGEGCVVVMKGAVEGWWRPWMERDPLF